MSEDKSIRDRAGVITHEEAREILSRFNNSHFRGRKNGETARYTIPADPRRDDDIRLGCYIDQNEERIAELERKLGYRKGECSPKPKKEEL